MGRGLSRCFPRRSVTLCPPRREESEDGGGGCDASGYGGGGTARGCDAGGGPFGRKKTVKRVKRALLSLGFGRWSEVLATSGVKGPELADVQVRGSYGREMRRGKGKGGGRRTVLECCPHPDCRLRADARAAAAPLLHPAPRLTAAAAAAGARAAARTACGAGLSRWNRSSCSACSRTANSQPGGVRPPAPPGEPYVIDDSLLRKVVHGAARCKSSKVNSLCEPLRFEFRLRDTPPRPV